MKWRVTCSALKDDDATHPGFEIVEADIRRIEDGALCFFRIVPLDPPGRYWQISLSTPKLIDVRGFNALKWDDYVIVEEDK